MPLVHLLVAMQLLVVVFGSIPTPQPVLARQRRIAWQRQPLRVEIVVDLAVASGVPAAMICNGRGLLSPLVVPQEVPDFMNEQRRVLLDGVRRQPGVVVVQTPVRIHGHAADQVGLDRNQVEERRREVAPLVSRSQSSRLQRARRSLRPLLVTANQISEPEPHVNPEA